MSFRISVESVIRYQSQVLLVKRAANCRVAPNVWNVPAGKVKMLETTFDAVIRETLEETQLAVRVVRLLAENAFTIQDGSSQAYRNMFTYLTEPIDQSEIPQVILNEEHTEYQWVSKDQLETAEYSSLMPRLKQIIMDALF